MSAANFRFRNEGALVVLQVQEPGKVGRGPYGYDADREPVWRDAKTEDLLDVAKLVAPRIVQERSDKLDMGFGAFQEPT